MRSSYLPWLAVSWCSILLLACPVRAEVAPAGVFADHVVLQREKPAPVWGWADRGERVTVEFAGQTKTAIAGEDGKWMVVLEALKLSTKPQTMTITGKQTVTVTDVLVGDVWICSGQSNMGRNVARSVIPEEMKWEHPLIRYWGAGKSAKYPVDRFELEEPMPWTVCSDEESTMGCCAVGFFFARRIQQEVSEALEEVAPQDRAEGRGVLPQGDVQEGQLADFDDLAPHGRFLLASIERVPACLSRVPFPVHTPGTRP